MESSTKSIDLASYFRPFKRRIFVLRFKKRLLSIVWFWMGSAMRDSFSYLGLSLLRLLRLKLIQTFVTSAGIVSLAAAAAAAVSINEHYSLVHL